MCDRWLRKWVIAFSVCAFSLGCDSEGELRGDAQRFLGAYQGITYDLRGSDLERRVRALEALPLGQAEVKETRDLCVAGHRAVLAQEELQEANAAAIDGALKTRSDGAPLDAATLARLKEKLDASQLALSGAREQLERCETKARALAIRFGKR